MSVDLRVGSAYILILRGSDSVWLFAFVKHDLYHEVVWSLASDLVL